MNTFSLTLNPDELFTTFVLLLMIWKLYTAPNNGYPELPKRNQHIDRNPFAWRKLYTLKKGTEQSAIEIFYTLLNYGPLIYDEFKFIQVL